MRRRRQQAVTTFLLIFFVVAVYTALGAELAAYSVQSLLELFYVQYIIYIYSIYFIYTYYNTSTNVYYIYYVYIYFPSTYYIQVVLVVFHHHYGPKNELQWNYNELAIYTFKVESENHWGCNMCLWKSSVISNVVVVVAASMKRERDPIFQGQGRFILGSLCYLL